jgi:glycosyltransferase involved in cell wall biosynthesis
MSLSRQQYPLLPHTKVYVADAASTDATAAIAQLTAAQLGLQLAVIPGGLPARGRNAGARLAQTPYVLFVDADVELRDPRLLLRAVTHMRMHALHCVTTDIQCPHGTAADRFLFRANNAVQRASRWGAPFATGMFMLFDRAVFQQLGGFDESALYAEDYLLTKQVERSRFGVVRGGVVTSNRRFQRMGRARIARMFLTTAINSRNPRYFQIDQGYWTHQPRPVLPASGDRAVS